jgi:hypothetical protein
VLYFGALSLLLAVGKLDEMHGLRRNISPRHPIPIAATQVSLMDSLRDAIAAPFFPDRSSIT